jgi:hypothetical protein
MKTTTLSSLVKIYDPIRKKQVAKTPEEQIRQWMLRHMIDDLAFPKGLISVECALVSGRRADIVSYHKKQETLTPLVVIECKAEAVEEAAYLQALGYQASLLAPFICLAHSKGIATFWKEGDKIRTIAFLPPYPQLIARLQPT